MTLADLNRADRPAFVAAIGFAFEDSPWIAAAAWERRPFADAGALCDAMAAVVREAPAERRLALIQAHPDLAGRVAREGQLTASSQREQAEAGLETPTPPERAAFDECNRAYRARFGFPFVICAREHDKASILAELERRTRNDRESEVATALREIEKIARSRIEGAVEA